MCKKGWSPVGTFTWEFSFLDMSKLKDLLKLKSSLEDANLSVPSDLLAQIAEEEEKEAKKNNGCVYILKNKYMPEIVKIGYTDRSLVDRCNELYTTGVPVVFEIFAYAITPNYKEFEQAIHQALASKRVNPQREFFLISPQNAFNTFLNHSAKYNVTPILYSNDGISILEDYERLTRSKKRSSTSSTQVTNASSSEVKNTTESISTKDKPTTKNQHDDSIFSWDGKTFYAKSRFVFEIVARVLKENPSYTYQDLLNIMPLRSASNRTLILLEELQEKSKDAQKRYVKDSLSTCDGKTFRVSTQWGLPDIERSIYPLLKKLGYVYTKISYDELTDKQVLFKDKNL